MKAISFKLSGKMSNICLLLMMANLIEPNILKQKMKFSYNS